MNTDEIKDDEYYLQLAIDELGTAIRDNSREERIEIEKLIDSGDWNSKD